MWIILLHGYLNYKNTKTSVWKKFPCFMQIQGSKYSNTWFIEQCLNVFGIILMMLCIFFTSLLCRSVAIIKSYTDTRYGLDLIVIHDGAKLPCLAILDLSSFRQKFGLDAYDQVFQWHNLWYMYYEQLSFIV